MAGRGLPVIRVREPGGTPFGEEIRRHLWVKPELSVPPLAELLLVSAARHTLITEVVEPSLSEGTAIIADRFALSTLAYQGYGRGLDLGTIRAVTAMAVGDVRPDLTLLVDVPVEVGTRRQDEAGVTPDRIEREGVAFMQRVRKGYLELAADEEDVVVVNGEGEVAEVQEKIRAAVAHRFDSWISRIGARSGGEVE